MAVKLKKLEKQTLVITGASSGIGLTTARMAARRGARLVLAARSEGALGCLANELDAMSAEAVPVVADVSREDDVQRIADTADERFGGFDTWVNVAGASIFGKLLDVPVADMRRLFETNFWGVVYGSLEAARHLRCKGGAIINLGSTLSDRAIALQGAYCASKHAVKAFTDTLRMELESESAPVSLTLIKPGAVDTPLTRHAKNYMEAEPRLPSPVYAPQTVARAILHCAEAPARDVYIGVSSKALSVVGQGAPRLTDKVMQLTAANQQKTRRPPRALEDNGLERPSESLEQRGRHDGYVFEYSPYTHVSMRASFFK